MVEIATIEDLDFFCDLAKRFNDKYGQHPLNKEKTKETLRYLITSDYGVMFRTKNGGILGTIEEDVFRDRVILKERGWFSEDYKGLYLIHYFIEHAKEIGVHEILFTTLENNKAASKILKRKGFVPVETVHSFSLTGE